MVAGARRIEPIDWLAGREASGRAAAGEVV